MSPLLGRLLVVWLAAAVAAAAGPGCGTRGSRRVGQMPAPEAVEDRVVSNPEVLQRELEITVLENYLQLTLGNMEAYIDTLGRDRALTMLGIGPDEVATGTLPENCSPAAAPERICGSSRDRLPFRGDMHTHGPCGIGNSARAPCLGVYSKNLQLHLAQDGSTAWVFDELAYRVPHQGREASIPLRYTAVFVRDVDRWVLVMEHLSHAMPIELVLALARDGKLAMPQDMPAQDIDLVRARMLLARVSRRLEGDREARAPTPADGSGEPGQAPAGELGGLLDEAPGGLLDKAPGEALGWAPDEAQVMTPPGAPGSPAADQGIQPGTLLWPYPYGEFHGSAFHTAPSLAEVLGPDTHITMHDIRLALSGSERVAWLAANLHARQGRGDSALTLGMRLTAVFERDASDQWHIMQMHVSVPVSRSQLREHALGLGLR